MFRLQVGMDQSQLLQFQQDSQHLVGDGPDILERERLELVLLKEVVEVLLKHLEHETGVVLVREALVGSHKVELISIFLAESGKNGDFNLPLSGVTWVVLEDLDGHNLVSPLLPALGHLTKGAPTQEFQHFILIVEGGVEHLMLYHLMLYKLVILRTTLPWTTVSLERTRTVTPW